MAEFINLVNQLIDGDYQVGLFPTFSCRRPVSQKRRILVENTAERLRITAGFLLYFRAL